MSESRSDLALESRLSQRALGARPRASGPAILFFPSLPPEGSTPHCTHCPIALSASRPCRPLLQHRRADERCA